MPKFRYIRFTPLKRRIDTGGVQLALLQIKYKNQVLVAKASNPGGTYTGGHEGPDKAVDGSIHTKWFDHNAKPLILDFGEAKEMDSYTWVTANDCVERDAISWTLEGSNDQSLWQVIDRRENYPTPTARKNHLPDLIFNFNKLAENQQPVVEPKKVEVPADFNCPITGEIMIDPVCTMDGHTYERQAIEEWFKKNSTSPKTGVLLTDKTTMPNWSLKGAIADWLKKNPQCSDEEFFAACDRGGDLEEIKKLLFLGANIEAKRGDFGLTALHEAIINNRLELAKFLVQQGADIHTRDKHGRGIWHNINESSFYQPVYDFLLEKKVDINAKDNAGDTPLHLGGFLGGGEYHMRKMTFLVEHGADLEAKGNNGCTPLHMSAWKGNNELARYLIQKGANTKALNNDKLTPYQLAEREKKISTAQVILTTKQEVKKTVIQSVQEVQVLRKEISDLKKVVQQQQDQINSLVKQLKDQKQKIDPQDSKKEEHHFPNFQFGKYKN